MSSDPTDYTTNAFASSKSSIRTLNSTLLPVWQRTDLISVSNRMPCQISLTPIGQP
jgi:hypothetical protein